MRFNRFKSEWWQPTSLPPQSTKVPKRLLELDPTDYDSEALPPLRRSGVIGSFSPSNTWVPYRKIKATDGGYIAPLYTLRDIRTRYGLTLNSMRYFKKHILPEPFGIVRRRNTSAHHWSRFVLAALDVTLLDLEALGYRQFLSSFTEHIDNLHRGAAFLEDYYAYKYEHETPKVGDEFGVSWNE